MGIATITNTVSASNGTKFAASFWVIPPADNSNPANGQFAYCFNCGDVDDNEFVSVRLYTNSSARKVLFDIGRALDPDFQLYRAGTNSLSYTPGSWNHIFATGDTASSALQFIYVNLVDKTGAPGANDTGFVSNWNGSSFGVPCNSSFAVNHNTSIQLAEMQIWLGTYIEPTAANLAKFATVTNGVGRPVNPTLAVAAFGTPTYSFRGNASQFPTNHGNGGAMSSSGTINSYTPVPGA